MTWRVLTGECLDVLATLEPDSVDACAEHVRFETGGPLLAKAAETAETVR